METIEQTLKERYETFKIENPKTRIREAAKALHVSEAELLSVADNVTSLNTNFADLFKRLPELGRVMSLTRNEGCVLEHKGLFEKIDIHGHVATVIGSIESRVFFNGWAFGFAAETPTNHGPMKNLQFFDKQGEAITKVYLQPEANVAAYEQLVIDFKADARPDVSTLIVPKEFKKTAQKDMVDLPAFHQSWREMKDTHEFFGMLRKYNLNRLDAVRWAESEFANEVSKISLQPLLEKCAQNELPIMIFVGNAGNIQIHQNTIHTVRPMDKWLNILDPDFNMHLNLDEIAHTWIVKKPTVDGIVTSIECFDTEGEIIVQFFGLRKPGKPELQEWKELLASID